MAKFRVEVYRDWREYGEIVVEAVSRMSARKSANEALEANSKDIEWDGITNTERVQFGEGIEKVTQLAVAPPPPEKGE